MNFKDLTGGRFSLRAYSPKPVESEKLEYILECVQNAPSAVNYQPFRFYVLQSEEMLEKIKSCYPRRWFAGFPICIVACADSSQSWHRAEDGKDHADLDVAIAVDHLTLAATEQGLGTCWVCNFDVQKCKEVLSLPENLEPVVLIPLGYAAKAIDPIVKKRKTIEELFIHV